MYGYILVLFDFVSVYNTVSVCDTVHRHLTLAEVHILAVLFMETEL